MTDDPGASGGVLFVVATPIGNLDDMTARAASVLRAADIIAAEDTRHSSALCARLGIPAPALVSLHDHNEAARIPSLVASLREGKRVALVSDAGTPLVSDPGYRLVSAAHDAGIRVSPLPGACAAIAALSAAGLPSDRFYFEGFLPASAGARRERLSALATQRGTLVFYEAPHRIAATLDDCVQVFGSDRTAVLAREITKTFETLRRDTLSALAAFVAGDANQQRGEIVLLVEGATAEAVSRQGVDADALLRALAGEMPATRAARLAARLLGVPKRDLYQRLLEFGASPE